MHQQTESYENNNENENHSIYMSPEKREYRTLENWRRKEQEKSVGGASIKWCSPTKCRSVAWAS